MAEKAGKKQAEKEQSFELSLKRLEEIVKKMENETLPLDELVELYKEGVELSVFCGSTLKDAEQKVTKIRKTAEAVFEKTPFDKEVDNDV